MTSSLRAGGHLESFLYLFLLRKPNKNRFGGAKCILQSVNALSSKASAIPADVTSVRTVYCSYALHLLYTSGRDATPRKSINTCPRFILRDSGRYIAFVSARALKVFHRPRIMFLNFVLLFNSFLYSLCSPQREVGHILVSACVLPSSAAIFQGTLL